MYIWQDGMKLLLPPQYKSYCIKRQLLTLVIFVSFPDKIGYGTSTMQLISKAPRLMHGLNLINSCLKTALT